MRDCYRSTISQKTRNRTSAYRTIPPSRLRRATSLYTREALVRCVTVSQIQACLIELYPHPGGESRGMGSIPSNSNKKDRPQAALFIGAGYGNRTRLHGLGSRCITDIRTLRRCGYYSKAGWEIQPFFVDGPIFPESVRIYIEM